MNYHDWICRSYREICLDIILDKVLYSKYSWFIDWQFCRYFLLLLFGFDIFIHSPESCRNVEDTLNSRFCTVKIRWEIVETTFGKGRQDVEKTSKKCWGNGENTLWSVEVILKKRCSCLFAKKRKRWENVVRMFLYLTFIHISYDICKYL